MNDRHCQRKVTCPSLPAVHLHRKELTARLNDVINGSTAGTDKSFSPYKLVLLYAPAGYGKTTMLVDFAQHTHLPCCWYSFDHTDIDRITFLATLLASIRQCFSDFGRDLDPLLTGAPSEHANDPVNLNYFETAIDALITAIEGASVERFVLILCNYQEINELPEMNNLISYLLQRLPTKLMLIIESRIVPDLDFARLLAGQMIFGIGTNQLRFTPQQIQEVAYLQKVEPLQRTEAEHLARIFDGWIAGILLGTRLGNLQHLQPGLSTPLFADASELQIASQYLFSYVVNEVFKSHKNAYVFLKDVSILQEMLPAICAALLDISHDEAYSHLHYLEQHGLFITHSDEGPGVIYTCTPILRKLLYEQLRRESPERFSYLHQRASELLSVTNNYSQAIYHALEASANDIAANLIIESTEQMINQGHAETLARWIDNFPVSTTNRYPKLLLIRVNIYLRQGNYSAASPLLDAADMLIKTLADSSASIEKHTILALQAEIAIARSKILFQQSEYHQGQLLCQRVLESLPADEVALRAEAHMRLGLCHILLGDFTAGIAQIQKALQLWGRLTIQRQTADGHRSLATAYSLLGNFALAEHHITRALFCWDQLQDIWGKSENLVNLGYIKLRQGAFAEAETVAKDALALARGSIRFVRGQAYALVCLGEIYLTQERYELALEVTEEALTLTRQINDQYLIRSNLCNLAMIYLYMGDTATALMLISEVGVQNTSGEPVGYIRATRDLIYGTIHLYQRQYVQAWPYLSESEAILGKFGLKQERLQALLRLAAYHLSQGQIADFARHINEALEIAAICEGYEQLAQMEIRHLPGLQKAIKTVPEMERARTLFRLEAEISREPASELLPAVEKVLAIVPSVAPGSVTEISVPQYKLGVVALGEPSVSLYHEPITRWRMARAMELFFYLLDCGRPMRKESLITALWQDIDEQTTRTFYSTIHYLRQALGGESIIIAKSGTYVLRLDVLYGDDVWYDVAAFEDYQAKARQALDEHEAEAKTFYQAMVDLYRGDYVQPFYSDWCTMRRDELRNGYVNARHQLAQIAWREESLDESLVHWQQMLAIDNCLEEAHYGLMRCYVRQGKRGLALRQYQRCKDIMQQEFGAVPRTSMQHLYQRLMGVL